MNISCNVMDDLLPLYAEDMVTADTSALVRDHLAACPVCREKMKAFPQKEEEMHQSLEMLSKLRKKIRDRRITASVFAFLLTATLLLCVVAYMISPVYLTLEEADIHVFHGENVGFIYHVGDDGQITGFDTFDHSNSNTLTLHFGGNVRHVAESRVKDPDTGEEILTITGSCRRMDLWFGQKESGFAYSREADFARLYYASYDGREDTLLWGSEPSGGVQTLPRLVMGYYFLIAAVLGAALLAVVFALRKKIVNKLPLAVGCWFAGFAVSTILVSGGNWPAEDATYVPWMMGFAVALASFMTATVLVGCKLWRQHSQDR